MIIAILFCVALVATVIRFQGVSIMMNRLGKFFLVSAVYGVFLSKVFKALFFKHN